VAAPLVAGDVIQDGYHFGFYPKIVIIKKWRKLNFNAKNADFCR